MPDPTRPVSRPMPPSGVTPPPSSPTGGLDDPNPTQYTGVLEVMADRNAMPAADADLAP